MEARSAFRGTGISKSMVAVLAVSVTLGLGVTAGVVAKNLSGSTAAKTHVVQAQGLPAAAPAVGPDDRPTTTQIGVPSFLGPDAQDRNAKLAGAAAPAVPPAAHISSRGNRYS